MLPNVRHQSVRRGVRINESVKVCGCMRRESTGMQAFKVGTEQGTYIGRSGSGRSPREGLPEWEEACCAEDRVRLRIRAGVCSVMLSIVGEAGGLSWDRHPTLGLEATVQNLVMLSDSLAARQGTQTGPWSPPFPPKRTIQSLSVTG